MAETVNTNDLRRGMVVELPEGLCEVLEFQHHKPGKGPAMVRTKVRNLETGSVVDKTFSSDSKVDVARIDTKQMQYLYRDDERYVFMDTETYEQTAIEVPDDVAKFLTENTTLTVAFHGEVPVSVALPTTVDLKVTATDPGLKGDRQSAGTKPATVETGAVVQVPLFVDEGETVRIDTRTGAYVTRVQ